MRRSRKKSVRPAFAGEKKPAAGKRKVARSVEVKHTLKLISRISTSMFEAEDGPLLHQIQYAKPTGYIQCSCPQFAFEGKCRFLQAARVVLEGEGYTTHVHRAATHIFIEEREPFAKRIFEVAGKLKKVKFF